MLPNPLILRWYVARALRLWVATRAIASLALAFGQEDPLHVPVRLSIALVAMSVGVCLLEVRIQHERALFANLGIPLGTLAMISALPAVVGELFVRIVGGLIR
jgi:hypothetical protein